MKPAILGFLAGALTAAILFRALRSPGDDATPSVAPAAGSQAPDLRPLAEAVRAAEADVESARQEIRELKSRRPEPPPNERPIAEARAEIAKGVLSLLDGENWKIDMTRPGDTELAYKLLALMRRLAAELGIGVEEVASSPEGKAALVQLLLDTVSPPLDGEARAAVEQAMKRLRADWEAFAAIRGPLMRLERAEEIERIGTEFDDAMSEALSGVQLSAYEVLDSLWERTQPVWVPDTSHWSADSTEDVASMWKDSWASQLELDERQKVLLGPIIDDYVRELAELKVNSPGIQQDLLPVAIRLQKKMAQMLALTPEQARVLAEQTEIYNYYIKPGR